MRSLSLCFFVCCCLCSVFHGDGNLGDSKELGLDAPFDVFSDVENFCRLPILKVFLIRPLYMQVVEPLVDLTPLQASLSDNLSGCLLSNSDAF